MPNPPPTDARPTSAARTTLSRIMTAVDTNLLGTVHGGVIMKLVDDVAGAVAQRHSIGPRLVPSVVPETEEDARRFAEAEIRRTHRLARRAAMLESRARRGE